VAITYGNSWIKSLTIVSPNCLLLLTLHLGPIFSRAISNNKEGRERERDGPTCDWWEGCQLSRRTGSLRLVLGELLIPRRPEIYMAHAKLKFIRLLIQSLL
jgi:hypothetical protein